MSDDLPWAVGSSIVAGYIRSVAGTDPQLARDAAAIHRWAREFHVEVEIVREISYSSARKPTLQNLIDAIAHRQYAGLVIARLSTLGTDKDIAWCKRELADAGVWLKTLGRAATDPTHGASL